MESVTASTEILVTSCPTDRCIGCTGLYTNKILQSTIVCMCQCHKKKEGVESVEPPLSNTIGVVTQEETRNGYR